MEAIEYGLSSLIFKSLKEGHGRLFIRMFVYLRTRSELLRDPAGSFKRIKFVPLQEEQSRSSSLLNCCSLS